MVACSGVHQSLRLPVQNKERVEQEKREYHLRKLYKLSLNSVGEAPQLERPTNEQKEWVNRRMKSDARSWERWFVGQYFTDEQKKELGLTDKYISRKGTS